MWSWPSKFRDIMNVSFRIGGEYNPLREWLPSYLTKWRFLRDNYDQTEKLISKILGRWTWLWTCEETEVVSQETVISLIKHMKGRKVDWAGRANTQPNRSISWKGNWKFSRRQANLFESKYQQLWLIIYNFWMNNTYSETILLELPLPELLTTFKDTCVSLIVPPLMSIVRDLEQPESNLSTLFILTAIFLFLLLK